MQNWFFLDTTKRLLSQSEAALVKGQSSLEPKAWLFRVLAPKLLPGQVMCVTGNIEVLGNWKPEKSVALSRTEENPNIWIRTLSIDNDVDVEFRYCICVVIEEGVHTVVRRWETNLNPRRIKAKSEQLLNPAPDVFGDYELENNRLDSGWLSTGYLVQFRLFQKALTLWGTRFVDRKVYVKLRPVILKRWYEDKPGNMATALEETLQVDKQDVLESPRYSEVLFGYLNKVGSTLEVSGPFGEEYHPMDLLVLEVELLELRNIAFLIDLYVYSSHAAQNEPPYHLGFTYLLPTAFNSSESHVVLPVTSVKHQPLGQIQLDYLVLKAMDKYKCDMRVSYGRYWKTTRVRSEMSAPDDGSAFPGEAKNIIEVRENTIASLKTAAATKYVDYLGIHLQLSKDLVPLIYQDFHVSVAVNRKKELHQSDMMEVSLKELTIEQLRSLKVYHLSDSKTRHPHFFDENLDDHQPFPTLQQALEEVNVRVGFHMEIKWNEHLHEETLAINHPLDMNVYVDTILEVVLKHAGQRRVIFTCVNPDICRMVRLKQNKYPVVYQMLGQMGRSARNDPRCRSIETGVQFAKCMGLLGVCLHVGDLIEDNSKVQLISEAGLLLFGWGFDEEDTETIQQLKDIGIHALVYNKIDESVKKVVKESIYMVDVEESQRNMLVFPGAKLEASKSSRLSERSLDVERAREGLMELSTATSFQSLDSNTSKEGNIRQ